MNDMRNVVKRIVNVVKRKVHEGICDYFSGYKKEETWYFFMIRLKGLTLFSTIYPLSDEFHIADEFRALYCLREFLKRSVITG
jgi:hypothetical protein